MILKKEIRKEALRRRNSLLKEDVLKESRAIGERLTALPDYQGARSIMFYLSSGSEVNTREMIAAALDNNLRVAVPLVRPETGEMKAIVITEPDRDLSPGFKGIMEPEYNPDRELSPAEFDLIIIPGVAFDAMGNRIGMGKGYYDRFLSRLSPKVRKIALAFESQIVASIPGDDNDVRMDMIITGNRVFYCTRT